MLVLSSLSRLLEQILSPSDVHTAVLLTPSGELVSFASSTTRPKDEIRVLIGLSREAWLETQGDEEGMLDSEVRISCQYSMDVAEHVSQMGRLLVVPIIPSGKVDAPPVMLLTLNAASSVDWGILQIKVRNCN